MEIVAHIKRVNMMEKSKLLSKKNQNANNSQHYNVKNVQEKA